jgi:integrase
MTDLSIADTFETEDEKETRKARGGIRRYKTSAGWRYSVQIRTAAFKGAQSFSELKDAKQWRNEKLALRERCSPEKIKMFEVIERAIAHLEKIGNPVEGRKLYAWRQLQRHDFLKSINVTELADKITAYCALRKQADKLQPQSIMLDYLHLQGAIKTCAEAFNWGSFQPLEKDVTKRLLANNLIAESKKRSRRPTGGELDKLRAHFAHEAVQWHPKTYVNMPMVDMIEVLALNGFRRGELMALRWSDLRLDCSSIICRNRKDPSAGKDEERWALVPVLPAAMAILLRQPRAACVKPGQVVEGVEPGSARDLIFPYSPNTFWKRFSAACVALGIEDLRPHDMRHEAISTISRHVSMTEGMAISGHKSAENYLRYANMEEEAKNISNKLSKVAPKTGATA